MEFKLNSFLTALIFVKLGVCTHVFSVITAKNIQSVLIKSNGKGGKTGFKFFFPMPLETIGLKRSRENHQVDIMVYKLNYQS